MGRISRPKKWSWNRERRSTRGRPSKASKLHNVSACETTPASTLPGLRSEDDNSSETVSLTDLHANIVLPDNTWVDQSTADSLKICRIHYQSSDSIPYITHSLTIDSDLCWHAHVHNQLLSSLNCSLLSSIPTKILSQSSLNHLITILHTSSICIGNPEFTPVVKQTISRQNAAIIDDLSLVTDSKGITYTETVRTSSCEILVSKAGRCSACCKYRGTLRSQRSRQAKLASATPTKRTDPSSHVNDRFLNAPEKAKKAAKRSDQLRSAKRTIQSLKDKLQAATAKDGVILKDLHDDFRAIFEENTSSVLSNHQPGSFKSLFWEQQAKALKTADKRQIKWHPMIIKWCLSLKLKSSSCYRAMRSSGVIVLPSERTLRDYTHVVKAQSGFSAGVDAQLKKEAKLETCPEFQRNVCLIFDEVKIKEDLVFNKHTGELIGFTDLGEINECLLRFEQAFTGSSQKPQLATHMLVFMVCGLLSDLEFPYAQFPTTSVSANQLYSLVWGCVRHLESIDFNVLAATCDGASPNRTYFNMHGSPTVFIHKANNIYSRHGHPLYFFSDVPHLIKTVRNCWANSFAHTRSRKLWINGHYISWQHLVDLYHRHNGNETLTSGLTILPKIKFEHIKLTSYSRMRVDLAAQVLSKSVAEAFELENRPETVETRRFVRIFNRFFDMLNVRSLREGILRRQPDKLPYKSPSDDRLKWLKEDFLGYLDEWDKCAQARKDLSAEDKKKCCISQETLQGLRISVNSFVELTEYILKQEGVKYFLSEKLCQDPLESFFGKQRMRGGYCENPNANSFLYGTSSLRVQGGVALRAVSGNCKRGRHSQAIEVDDTPLPKRPRKQSKKKKKKD